jgi:hypothetical protein
MSPDQLLSICPLTLISNDSILKSWFHAIRG